MKIAKIIFSSILSIATITFLVLSIVFNNETIELIFKISATATITLSITLNLTINIKSIKNSFNTTNIYNSKSESLANAWQSCFRINSQIETVLGLFEQKKNYTGNKEKDINDILERIEEMSTRTKELICVYDGSKEVTLSENERLKFVSEYIDSLDAIKEFSPIIMNNSVECTKRINGLILILRTIKDKYCIYVSKIKES